MADLDVGLSLPGQLDAILEVVILAAEQDENRELGIEVSQEEVVVGDFHVPRQE